jgi:hypothetical protein
LGLYFVEPCPPLQMKAGDGTRGAPVSGVAAAMKY